MSVVLTYTVFKLEEILTLAMAVLADNNLELAVCGFIRELQLSVDTPNVIQDVIIEFAKTNFNWQNSIWGDNAFILNDEDPTRISVPLRASKTGFLAMDDVLSLDICKKFEWEVEIANRVEGKYLSFMIGVVKHPRGESIKAWWYHFGADEETKSMQFGVYVSSTYKNFRRYGGPDENDGYIGDKVANKWQKGDRFKVIVDLEERTMSFMYNDQDMGIIFTNLPDKVVPAIGIHSSSFELKCTKYQFI